MSRFRITVRGTGVELRGYIDGDDKVRAFAGALVTGMDPTDPMLVVSPVADDWTPFGPSAPTKVVTLPGDDPDASSRPPLDRDEDWAIGGAGGWGTRGQEGDG